MESLVSLNFCTEAQKSKSHREAANNFNWMNVVGKPGGQDFKDLMQMSIHYDYFYLLDRL